MMDEPANTYEALLDDDARVRAMLSLARALKKLAKENKGHLNCTQARDQMNEVIEGVDAMLNDSCDCGALFINGALAELADAEEAEHEQIERGMTEYRYGVGR